MRRHPRFTPCVRTALTLAGALLLSGSAFAQSVASPTLPDAQIEANVLKALAAAPQLASEHIATTTVYGAVTLSGSVKDEPTRKMAETLAARAEGVKKVVDELTLGNAPTAPDTGQGTNPMLQSDGTMVPSPNQTHAPDPDVYAAQHGIGTPPAQDNPSNADNHPGNYDPPPPQPAYRQPYNNQQPYPQQGGGYHGQQQPPPYGAQQAGLLITVPQGSLLRIRINEGLDSKHAQPDTPFDAIVLNDVVADGAVAIPRGASVQGKVTGVKSGGVLAGHGEIALQLTQVTLGGKTFPIVSDIWSRNSSDKGLQTANNAIGLGAAGAIIGAIAGGGAGAAIGAGAGGLAGIGTSAASGSRQVLIPSEAILTFHLAQPAPMTTISQAEMDRLSYGVPAGAQQQPRMVRRYPAPYYGPVYYPRPYPYAYPYPY